VARRAHRPKGQSALAIAQGAHPLAIRERLGHSPITVTMDRYGGLFPRLDEAIADALAAVLRDPLAASLRPGAAASGEIHAFPQVRKGAGEGNRTPVTSLEGWSSTIELRPRATAEC
jgi:hypothetical protein